MLLKRLDSVSFRLESVWEVAKRKLGNIPKLVAELRVANYSLHIQINVTLNHVSKQGESETVSTTLWDTIRELLTLVNDSLSNFALC